MELTLLVVPVATFLMIAIPVMAAAGAAQRREFAKSRVGQYSQRGGGQDVVSSAASALRDDRLSNFTALDQILRRLKVSQGMAMDLARAALPLRVGEYVLIRLMCSLVLAFPTAIAGLVLPVTLMFAVLGFYLPKFYVARREKQRVKKVNEQLVDVTTLVSNSLKSGSSFVQGLELVSREMPPPISEEVSQMLAEMNLGSSTEESLTNLTKRVRSYDLDLIVTAMLVQRQVGGNLAEVLEAISSTIRERIRMLREISALTAEMRFSSQVLGVFPLVLIGALFILNRNYLMQLVTTGSGQIMLGVAIVMQIIGFIVMRRLTDIEV